MRSNLPVTQKELPLSADVLIVSKTDLKGMITYVNSDFITSSGYSESELIGQPHNIIRHPDMPAEAFADLWATLKEERPWIGMVKNRCKNGDHYWVEANVTPLHEGGRVTGYMSVRRRALRQQVDDAEATYRLFRDRQAGNLVFSQGQVVRPAWRFLRDLPVVRKLGVGIGTVIALAVLIAVLGLLALREDHRGLNDLYHDGLLPSQKLKAIDALVMENRVQLLLSLQHDPKNRYASMHKHKIEMHLDQIEQNIAQQNALRKDYRAMVTDPQKLVLLAVYEETITHYENEGLLASYRALRQGNFDEAEKILLAKVNVIFPEVKAQADKLYAYEIDSGALLFESAETRYQSTQLLLVGAALLALLTGVALTLLMMRLIRRPLDKINQVFHRIVQGDYHNPIDIARNDEFGKVLQALQSMQTQLGFSVAQTERVAEENRRIRVGLDNVATYVMIADAHNQIIYLNHSFQKMFARHEARIAQDLPGFSAERLVGSNIDAFHAQPGRQRELLSQLQGTHRAKIELGGLVFAMTVTAVLNDDGDRIGTVVEWRDQTAELAVEKEVADIVQAAAAGDFSRRLNLEQKRGFYLQLAQDLNVLLETAQTGLADVAQVLGAMARGDLTRAIKAEYQGTFGQLRDDANTTVQRLREIVGAIKGASELIDVAVSEIAIGNQELSGRTEEQASSLEQTASSMEQLSSAVTENAENARQAMDLARSAQDVAERGGGVVDEVVRTMGEIHAASSRIAEITGVIDGLAFQTNILALNAAVEAARAGEQGRGFAVVATEVRNLAQRCAAAAREIKGLIADSVDRVESGSRLVDQAGSTMETVVGTNKRLAKLMIDIAAASREQSSGINQVSMAVSHMDQMTQQNAALVEEAAAAAESLGEQVCSLTEAVSVFQVGTEAPGRAASMQGSPSTMQKKYALPGNESTPKSAPLALQHQSPMPAPDALPRRMRQQQAWSQPAAKNSKRVPSAPSLDDEWEEF